jgi:predicted HAD superfamily Cof-like phosphohydrolase
MPKQTVAEMVREFHEIYGCAITDEPSIHDYALRSLRMDLIEEEVQELGAALFRDHDIVEVADALGDIAYVVYGAAISFGIDLDAVIAEIHRSNMSKLGEDGKPIYREDGKVLKSRLYSPTNLRPILGLDDA